MSAHVNASDVLILGAGHNGLVCAAYLAAKGLRVRMLERRAVVGGAAVTESFWPGFRNSSASYTVSLLNPKIIAELNLAAHGLRIVERPYANFLPLPGGDSFRLQGGAAGITEVARHSRRDAERLPDYYAMLERAVVVLRALSEMTPPNLGDRLNLADWLASARVVRSLGALSLSQRAEILDFFTKSAGDLLDQWFECDALKAALGWDAVVGNFASPYAPGTAYVLLHHVFGEVNGKPGAWGHAIGGMGAISEALAAECRARGVEILTEAEVEKVEVHNGRASAARLTDGRRYTARVIAANLHPKLLLGRLLDADTLPPATHTRVAQHRNGSGTFRMNVALAALPDFIAAPGTTCAPHHQAGILIGPTLAYFERAWYDARSRAHNPGWARAPIVELVISSTLDDSLAPPGQHVASLFCQHVNPVLDDGWDVHRQTVAELMIDTVDQMAPNFRASVLGYKAWSPADLEREFGLVGGDIFHGALGLDQLFSARPLLGMADYRMPVRGLYLCGAGAHPGGGVSGLPGRNAAREILKDLRRSRLFGTHA